MVAPAAAGVAALILTPTAALPPPNPAHGSATPRYGGLGKHRLKRDIDASGGTGALGKV